MTDAVAGIYEAFVRIAQENGERFALRGDGDYTYAQLHAAVERMAARIAAHDDDGPVLVMGPLASETIVMILAVLAAGRVVGGLDSALPDDRLREQIALLKSRVICLPASERQRLKTLSVEDLTVIDAGSNAEPASGRRTSSTQPDDPAFILFTSGSTGRPKAVIQPHSRYLRLATQFESGKIKRVLLWRSLAYSGGISALLKTLLTGGTGYLYRLKERGLSGLSHYLQDNGIDNLTLPVNMFREYLTLMEQGEPPPRIYSLRVAGVIYGRDLRRARGLLRADTQITNGYSISEAFLVAQNVWTSSDVLSGDDEIVPVGRPLAAETVELRDDDGRAVAVGETGRIYLRGPELALGYYGDAEATAARFRTIDETGLREYDTGDIGSFGADGQLRVHGRADGVVKVRGVRIGLDEVDGALTGLPEVQQAVAYVVQTDDEEELGATLTLRAGADLDMQRLREALLPVLAEAKIPSAVRVATQLPRTHTGKVDRRAAQAAAADLPRLAARATNAAAPPKGEIERQLAQIWKDVLGRRVDDRHADFFALGGHSLKAMRLIAQVEKRMNVALTMADIAQGPSLLEQAVLVNERMRRGPAESASRPALVTFAEQGAGAPICVVPPSNGTAIEQMPLAKALGRERTVHVLQPLGLSPNEQPIASADVLADAYLQTLRTVITNAGVVLIGVCSGSRYALMMAQWLQAQGKEPELVVLLDPTVARERARPRHEMTIGDHLSYGFELLRYRQYGRLKTYFLGGIKRNALRLVSERHRRMHEMHVATSRAAWRSRVSPYSGRTLIVTSEETERFSAARKDWTKMCSGRYEVACMSGTTHRDIVIGKAAEPMAAAIRSALAGARDASDPSR